jgi:hypothetical protein
MTEKYLGLVKTSKYLGLVKKSQNPLNRLNTENKLQMGCPALGIWVGFLKQPALPGEAPQKKILKKKSLITHHK